MEIRIFRELVLPMNYGLQTTPFPGSAGIRTCCTVATSIRCACSAGCRLIGTWRIRICRRGGWGRGGRVGGEVCPQRELGRRELCPWRPARWWRGRIDYDLRHKLFGEAHAAQNGEVPGVGAEGVEVGHNFYKCQVARPLCQGRLEPA